MSQLPASIHWGPVWGPDGIWGCASSPTCTPPPLMPLFPMIHPLMGSTFPTCTPPSLVPLPTCTPALRRRPPPHPHASHHGLAQPQSRALGRSCGCGRPLSQAAPSSAAKVWHPPSTSGPQAVRAQPPCSPHPHSQRQTHIRGCTHCDRHPTFQEPLPVGTRGHLVVWSEGDRRGSSFAPTQAGPASGPGSSSSSWAGGWRVVPRHLPLGRVHVADAPKGMRPLGNPGQMGQSGGPQLRRRLSSWEVLPEMPGRDPQVGKLRPCRKVPPWVTPERQRQRRGGAERQ